MTTIVTKIKDFKIGDRFIFHEAIFEVTGELKVFGDKNDIDYEYDISGKPEKWHSRSCYQRACKFISARDNKKPSGLLMSYDGMQGTEEVTYSKIIS